MGIPENQWVSEDGSLVDRRVFSDDEIGHGAIKVYFRGARVCSDVASEIIYCRFG